MRGLTELTREGEVPVWGVKWPVASVRPSVRSHSQPPRTCHVHAFGDDLGAINDRQWLDSMSESDSGPRCRIRMALRSKAIWPSTITRTGWSCSAYLKLASETLKSSACVRSKDASHVVNSRSRLRTKPRPGSAKSEGYLALIDLNRSRMLDNSARCALNRAKKTFSSIKMLRTLKKRTDR